jgi:hypothetical protein
VSAYETYWQVIELAATHDHPPHHTYTVPAATSRILHQISAPYRPTHRVISARRRRCDIGVAVRLVLESSQDPGEPVVLHIWRIRRTPAT